MVNGDVPIFSSMIFGFPLLPPVVVPIVFARPLSCSKAIKYSFELKHSGPIKSVSGALMYGAIGVTGKRYVLHVFVLGIRCFFIPDATS